MELTETIRNRRSIRKFKDTTIPKEMIGQLIEAARLCQSAKNRQPWKFLILEGEKKDRIADIMLELFHHKNIKIPGYANSSKSSARTILQAPVLILVFREQDEDWNTGDLLSIGAAIEHICLKATDLGLGSLWIRDTVYTQDEICKYAGYPQLELISAISIGYPDESPAARPRKPLSGIILKNT